jgi:hypothetical protein
MSYAYDPLRRALVVGDARLTKLMQREPETCAALSEYAARTGIETGQVIQLLGPAVDEGIIAFEIWADEIFINTAPAGRPTPTHLPEVAPNMWERLRVHGTVEEAYSMWRLVRSLERAGWRVETNPNRIMFGLSQLPLPPALGIQVANSMVPLVVHPTLEQLAHPQGLLSMFDHAGAASVGVICDSGALDEMITASRRWGFTRHGQTGMSVIVFEAPRYAPTLMRPGDASVAPRSVSQEALQGYGPNAASHLV